MRKGGNTRECVNTVGVRLDQSLQKEYQVLYMQNGCAVFLGLGAGHQAWVEKEM